MNFIIFFRKNKRSYSFGFLIHHIIQKLVIHVRLRQTFPDYPVPSTMKDFLEKIIDITKYKINDIPRLIEKQLLTNINDRHIVD